MAARTNRTKSKTARKEALLPVCGLIAAVSSGWDDKAGEATVGTAGARVALGVAKAVGTG